jgi:hypothetical protein
MRSLNDTEIYKWLLSTQTPGRPALHKKVKIPPTVVGGCSDPIYKEAPFLLEARSAPEGFRNPINDLSKPDST